MQMTAQVLTGSTQTILTKKGEQQQKTKLKVIDLGPEAGGGDVYFVDLWGEAALGEDELRQVMRQQATIEVRRVSASLGKNAGQAFLNVSGGAVVYNGQVVQRGLRAQRAQSA